MSKENQSKEQNEMTSKKRYVVLALVALLAVIGIVMNNNPEEETVVVSAEPEVTANVVEEKPVEELAVARIDITTPLVNADEPQLEVYVDDSEILEKQAGWMSNLGYQGYVIQRSGTDMHIDIKVKENTDIKLTLRGPDKRDENKKFIPVWVNYTSVTINGEDILSEPIDVWHSSPFIYTINAEKGEEYIIHAKWNAGHK